ncbi:MAG: 4-alpha-glucanotransferase [Candidatus Gastranaerophilales bacterium]|nr:4-alpha-glucanotransferase [Candidatus Gastranaerophilales bacterium]
MRRAGILMPVSSLPSRYGIGTFGRASYDFVDFLEKAGQKLWQILPLGPTGYGDSPYQSFSTFAGNPYYIDLEELIRKGYLTKEECDACDFGSCAQDIDYEKIYLSRFQVLRKAWQRATERGADQTFDYLRFVEENSYWLEDYALYTAVKDIFGGVCFLEWDEDIRLRKKKALARYREKLAEEIDFCKFQQYLFWTQWQKLKAYANKKGIRIVGDIPIYVALDSADTWANPKLFQLDESGKPVGVAGCPPDAFAVTGQLWGNPLYNWKYHKKTEYKWWIQRIAHCYRLYDVLRIDHFRGFDAYWFVPYGDATAENGHWEKGPGYELFAAIKKELGKMPVIAEDLGFLTDSVVKLVKKTGYPSMKVLQFAFEAGQDSEYLPHHYDKNCVVYTGTHDNDSTLGWMRQMPAKDLRFAMQYLQLESKRELPWALIRAAIACSADTAIIPMQDYLGLGSESRINVPSTLGSNWRWRMEEGVLSKELARKIKKMTKLYGRI